MTAIAQDNILGRTLEPRKLSKIVKKLNESSRMASFMRDIIEEQFGIDIDNEEFLDKLAKQCLRKDFYFWYEEFASYKNIDKLTREPKLRFLQEFCLILLKRDYRIEEHHTIQAQASFRARLRKWDSFYTWTMESEVVK